MSSTTSPSAFLSTPGLHWPSRILRLRRIGRPASWRVESWRVNVQSCLVEILPIVNDFFFRLPPFFAVGAALLRLGLGPLGDLGDEEPLLADQLLRFFLGGGVDRVLDLPPGVVHRFVLIGRHRRAPRRVASVFGCRSVAGRSGGCGGSMARLSRRRASSRGRPPRSMVRPAWIACRPDSRRVRMPNLRQASRNSSSEASATTISRSASFMTAARRSPCGPCSRCCCTSRSPCRRRTSWSPPRSGVMPSSMAISGAGLELGPAVGADLPDQPLRQHGLDRGGDQERRQPHVAEPGDRRRGVVGVQGA